MAEKRDFSATESQSQSRVASGGGAIRTGRRAACLFDDVIGKVAAATTLKLASHRAVGALRILAATASGGPKVGGANHIARANDHGGKYKLLRMSCNNYDALMPKGQ